MDMNEISGEKIGEYVDSASYMELRRRYVSSGVPLEHPITFVRGANALLYDESGRAYIDLTSGIGVATLGHVNEELVREAVKQLQRLWHICIHVANYPPYLDLARRLSEVAPMRFEKSAAFFNSGAEAVENSVKIARQWTGRKTIIAFDGAFHGRTYMALTLTGKYKPYKVGFDPFVPGVEHVPYPYCYRCPFHREECTADAEPELSYIRRLAKVRLNPGDVAAIIVEPIQGEAGFIVPPKGFLEGLREIADELGALLIVDEVQTGLCRTGRMFAFQHWNIEPDIVVVGKALANGLPISGVVGRADVLRNIKPGSIGGTFTGNPVSAAVALKVLEILERDELCSRALRLGRIMEKRLEELYERFEVVGDVRGLGVMRAMELVSDKGSRRPAAKLASRVVDESRRRGLLLIKAGIYSNVIRFHPPLTIEEELLERAMDILEASLKASLKA